VKSARALSRWSWPLKRRGASLETRADVSTLVRGCLSTSHLPRRKTRSLPTRIC